ncbi:PDZK1-interacting protein 1 isoform X2 [Fundulus heteroclitus]|uniref:PDZK1-interacting protein 1 isoform X2 n=1 Tax=Fundulus heteroclitus TaxID=8078 RepID=UPI00165A4F2B|nr:PDZK1-interacting protein 1 isoform X2 [Fundulus heteroclitus]
MGSVSELASCLLLLLLGAVTAQTGQPPHYERLLPQWLTGIIAVCSFLILTFVGFLVKKVWCEKSSDSVGRDPRMESVRENQYEDTNPYDRTLDNLRPRTSEDNKYETRLDILRNRDGSNIYDNCIFDSSEDKSTAM